MFDESSTAPAPAKPPGAVLREVSRALRRYDVPELARSDFMLPQIWRRRQKS